MDMETKKGNRKEEEENLMSEKETNDLKRKIL